MNRSRLQTLLLLNLLRTACQTSQLHSTKLQRLRGVDDGESDESESEWEEVDPNDGVEEVDEYISSFAIDKSENMDEDEELDVSTCFMCDQKHDNIKNCIVHMHKNHGFFIPDIEYLKDPAGLLTYVGLSVKN